MKNKRKMVGLALGGGAVRGWAHIGVLSVFEEHGIPVDFVSGTSVGSMIAAAYCTGKPVDWIREKASMFRWRHIIRPVWPKRGFVNFDKLSKWIIDDLGILQFSDLKIPLAVVATDLSKGVPVTFREGLIAPAVQASCSIPGLVTPVEYNGFLLCDGSISDTVPVKALRQMGAELVIAVDIFSYKIRHLLGPLGYLGAAIEILIERAGGGIAEADLLISPDLSGKTYLRFSNFPEFYELGRIAALNKVEAIKEILYS